MQLLQKQVGLQGNEEMKPMCAKPAPIILGMEVALLLSFDQKCVLRQPNLWLNIRLRSCSAVAGCMDMMYKHTGRHVCLCLNISSKNRNPMDLGISDSCVMSVTVLEYILSDSEKCVIDQVTMFNNSVQSCLICYRPSDYVQ